MSLSVRFSEEAVSELDAAAVWYDDQRPGLGATFVDAVDGAIARLANWPEAGIPVSGIAPDLDVREAPIPRFPSHVA